MGRKESNNIDFDFLIRNDGILRSFPLGFNQKVLAQLEGKRVSQYEWAWETSGLQKDLIYRERGERLTGVGLACFHLWVVDLDIKNGFDGVAEFKRIKGRNGLPRTWMASTPSGGRHIYFRRPSAARAATYGLGRQKEALLPGIDLRTGRSHVIFPGSRVDGVEYSWSSDSWSPKAIDVGQVAISSWLASQRG